MTEQKKEGMEAVKTIVDEVAEVQREIKKPVKKNLPTVDVAGNYLENKDALSHLWQVAGIFSEMQSMVPAHYKNRGDCFAALNMARDLDINPITFMQKSYPVKGKIGIEGQLAIAIINKSGIYETGVRFEYGGEGDDRRCLAFGVRKDDGSTEKAAVSVKMAKDAGWYGKNPLWRSITDQMLAYRAGIFLARRYHPDMLLGMYLKEEIGKPVVVEGTKNMTDKINSLDDCKVAE